jgi:hypothetical protein
MPRPNKKKVVIVETIKYEAVSEGQAVWGRAD